MHITKYFTLDEFIKSSTAEKYKIDNTPDEESLKNLESLMEFLDPIRDKWCKPIVITSGYRCPDLNRAVGGSKTSSHCSGLACDLKYQENLFQFLIEYLKDKEFDQLIMEYSGSVKWIHLGIGPKMRKQILVYKNGKYSNYKK